MAATINEQISHNRAKGIHRVSGFSRIPYFEFISNINTLLDEISNLDKLLTKEDCTLLLILTETHKNRLVVLKSIIRRLSLTKKCSLYDAQNIINSLKKKQLVEVIRNCPKCGLAFSYLPITCEECGYHFNVLTTLENDKRCRPKYIVDITEKGRSYISTKIDTISKANSFISKWRDFVK
jgi:predicted Zn-ribbon and HTH transcriptional regulator